MSGLKITVTENPGPHKGCLLLRCEERVSDRLVVVTELVSNPEKQARRDAVRELEEKHENAVAKAKWRVS